MTIDPAPVICAFDDGEPARRAALAAAWLARELGAPLVLATVVDPGALAAQDQPDPVLREALAAEQLAEERGKALAALARMRDELEPVEASEELLEGRPVAELLRLAEERRAALLVSGTALRQGAAAVLDGSVSGPLAARAACPVAVVAPRAAIGGAGPVLAGYDGSPAALHAARHAAALAAGLGRPLLLARAGDGAWPDADAVAADVAAAPPAARGGRGAPPAIAAEAVDGDPTTALPALAAARDAPLIVVGTRGRGPLRAALFGSVSLAVVRAAERTVVLVPKTAAPVAGAGEAG